jgi:hypothetical protein
MRAHQTLTRSDVVSVIDSTTGISDTKRLTRARDQTKAENTTSMKVAP